MYVLDGMAVSASASANDGMGKEWAISVRNWKWAPRGLSLVLVSFWCSMILFLL